MKKSTQGTMILDAMEKSRRWDWTDEHKARVPEWNRRWTDVVTSTVGMTDEDREITRRAVLGLYEAAKLPAPRAIVFVRSPMEGAIVAGCAAAWWYLNDHPVKARDMGIARACQAATRDATWAATRAATWDATRDGRPTDLFQCQLAAALAVVGDTDFSRLCVQNATNMYTEGNHAGAWCSWMSFVRDVVGWSHPTHEKYRHYELACLHSGGRFMHERFCVVCDRPSALRTRIERGVHQLHAEDGPALAWRDGHARWYLAGTVVDEQITLRPETQTVPQIDQDENADRKAVRIERFGWARYLLESGAEIIDHRVCEITDTTEALMQTRDGSRRLLVTCPTRRRFAPGVPADIKTCEEAQKWLAGPLSGMDVIART